MQLDVTNPAPGLTATGFGVSSLAASDTQNLTHSQINVPPNCRITTPSPSRINADKIPAELKAIPNWCVWRAVERPLADGTVKVTKPPYRSSDPTREAIITDRSTWSTFEDAWQCYLVYAAAGVAGIGFNFTRDCGFFGVDLDTERKVLEQHLVRRRNTYQFLHDNIVTYTEVSPSGDGLHFICKGTMQTSCFKDDTIGIEIYGWDRYFTVTGHVMPGREIITDQQGFADSLPVRETSRLNLGDLPEYRRMDLPDEEVVRLASNANTSFAPRYGGTSRCGVGEWSESFMAVVGGLDRITGSVEQIKRIVKNSPMVLHVGPAGNNETRAHKAERLFPKVLTRVREGNTPGLASAEHGRQVWEGMQRAKEEQAKAAIEALRLAAEAVSKLSKGSASLLDAFPQLYDQHKVLTRPPGLMGEFVAATERASFLPFTKYAIPAAFAVLSGITGRGFKLSGGSGLNVNFILAAPSSTGKTQVMKAWERFITQALEELPATPAGPPKTRIINSSTSSIQAMMEDFQERPACVWFVEECNAQLSSMSKGKTPVEAALRDAYNQLYDCAAHGSMFSGPRSVAARKAQLVPINNLCVSTFWTTVTSKLDLFVEFC